MTQCSLKIIWQDLAVKLNVVLNRMIKRTGIPAQGIVSLGELTVGREKGTT